MTGYPQSITGASQRMSSGRGQQGGGRHGANLGEEQKPELLAARSPLHPTISPSCSC